MNQVPRAPSLAHTRISCRRRDDVHKLFLLHLVGKSAHYNLYCQAEQCTRKALALSQILVSKDGRVIVGVIHSTTVKETTVRAALHVHAVFAEFYSGM